MDAAAALERLGGTAEARALLRLTTRRRLRRAIAHGRVLRLSRGRYALPAVVDCARILPFDEALAVADSALRSGLVTRAELDAIDVRGAGAGAVRHVLRHADRRAANPFESVLRALCIEAGIVVEPQAGVDLGTGTVHPDLVCHALRTAIEADSWSFHASRTAHRRDCARYNLLVIHGWQVLRFTWEQVMHDQAYVRWVLAEVARIRPAGTPPSAPWGRRSRARR